MRDSGGVGRRRRPRCSSARVRWNPLDGGAHWRAAGAHDNPPRVVRKPRIYEKTGTAQAQASVSAGVRVSTRMLLHWAQIALEQEAAARTARRELERRRDVALRTGAGLELGLELHRSMVAAAASASSIDALYGEVAELAEVPQELRDRWRESRTARHVQIFETLRRGFRIDPNLRGELRWLYKDQRDALLHPLSGSDIPQPHPLGVNTAPEYTIYTCESATRAVMIT